MDDFKWVNDNFGLQKGDEVLKRWGEIIRSELRSSDVAVRYGGEEVLLIFPYTRKEDAGKAITRIGERLSIIDFGIGRKVTFSAGVCGYPEDFDDVVPLEEFIRLADE